MQCSFLQFPTIKSGLPLTCIISHLQDVPWTLLIVDYNFLFSLLRVWPLYIGTDYLNIRLAIRKTWSNSDSRGMTCINLWTWGFCQQIIRPSLDLPCWTAQGKAVILMRTSSSYIQNWVCIGQIRIPGNYIKVTEYLMPTQNNPGLA